ncbi:MAG: DUF2062 domain-containing protein [Gammaproteobacteria bacterium]|nr:MAG: DUF2062 domain-containing protein [Gammaproteobacteria bacterium]
MPKKFIRKFLPDPHKIRDHDSLKIFGDLLHDPNLWHLNRRSVSSAFAVGLFCMWLPIPFQMVLAAAVAIMVRSNLPISAALVWITNPVTMPPMFYSAYKLGAWMLSTPAISFSFEPSVQWLMNEMLLIWKPFLTGCFTLAVVSALAGYFVMRMLWRLHIVRYIQQKSLKRLKP